MCLNLPFFLKTFSSGSISLSPERQSLPVAALVPGVWMWKKGWEVPRTAQPYKVKGKFNSHQQQEQVSYQTEKTKRVESGMRRGQGRGPDLGKSFFD